ncbi:hypothetical protein FXO37_27107 [Capsicum annuum]|nr:hypothetical protein FXO37_27107 [Capsicum annuum]
MLTVLEGSYGNAAVCVPIGERRSMRGRGGENLKRGVDEEFLSLQKGQSIIQVVDLRSSNIIQVTDAKGGHGFKPWKQPLAKMQGKAAYDTPLWWDPSLDSAHSGSFSAPGENKSSYRVSALILAASTISLFLVLFYWKIDWQQVWVMILPCPVRQTTRATELTSSTLLLSLRIWWTSFFQLVPEFLKVRGLLKQHLDSNYFVKTEIKKIVRANQEIRSTLDPIIYLSYMDVHVGEPSMIFDAVTEKLSPQKCRLSDRTYAAPIYVTIRYTTGSHGQTVESTKKNVIIGRMPIMLSSCFALWER